MAAAARTLRDAEVHVWRASLNVDAAVGGALERTLSAAERHRASRFHAEKDRLRYTVARGLLRSLLAGYLDAGATDLEFAQGEHGKPSLHAPDARWLRFNLSHSGDLMVVAAARDREVGVDVERVRESFPVDDVARRFLTVRERATLDAVPADQRLGAFFATWTRKEAYLKGLGVGLGASEAAGDADPARWTVGAVDVGAGHAAAVAVEGRAVTVPRVAQQLALPVS